MSGTFKYPWSHNKRYNDFSTHFRSKFEGRVQKISVNAGFSCPNRDGTRGFGGCTYCNNKTFQPSYCDLNNILKIQLEEGIAFFSRKYTTMRYLAYFQSYTNTYAPIPVLRELYIEALQYPGVIGLVIATRPDCLSDEVLDLLEELSQKCYLMVELGIETIENRTLERINRGHTWEESLRALRETARRSIHNCAHLILGLPGENYPDFIEQAHVISTLPVEIIKLHQLQIHTGTAMAHEFAKFPDRFHPFTVEEYAELVVDYLENLNPTIIVERFVSSAPDAMVIAPRWGIKNYEFVAKVEKRLLERDTWQGKKMRELRVKE
ncbi:MAG: TIGR01212 family radical SAM protein [Bacteroidia bacterium]|nr:TIGR01212 family radical SAM protein [Bacteroidia bacterium]